MGVVDDLRRVVAAAPRLDGLESRRERARRLRSSGGALRRSAVLVLFGVGEQAASRGVHADGEGASVGDLDVVLTVRSEALSHHPGEVAFPGGGLEPTDDGDPMAAALREAWEETGIEPSDVTVLGMLPEAALTASANLVTPVLGWWASPRDMRLDGTETRWATRVGVGALVDPAARRTWVLERGGHVWRGPAFITGDDGPLVWGFTAAVLSTVIDVAGWAVPWNEGREISVRG
ncbi:NUDIX domain-containing protein [Actinomyces ruminicola]|uniref:NUDIX domain-containing protein n=1 Tax=Actinomyces ruminicola TaxID=332524 RepID=A0A1H0FFH8_9ACTO|nr:CoA pyrophosphatase [Actinomyces ruminicola]SDN93538.1 NUDIX domain-containing protein [Actinomyces ruminicola]